jgi:predicted small lipoprotein YifL
VGEVREQNSTWVAVLVVVALATLVGLAGCAGGPKRLPQCEGKATPINVSQPAERTGHER